MVKQDGKGVAKETVDIIMVKQAGKALSSKMVKVWRNKNVKEGKSKVKEKFLSAENTNKRGKCTMASVALQNYNIMRLERAVEVVGVHLLSTD